MRNNIENCSLDIYILIDALGADFVQDSPFLNDICPYRKRLKTVLGYSSAAIPTILTGRLPDSHLHWCYYYLDKENSPFIWFNNLSSSLDSLSYDFIKEKTIKEANIQGYFNLYNVPKYLLPMLGHCEKGNIWAPNGINNGQSLFDILDKNNNPYYVSNWRLKDVEAIQLAKITIENRENNIIFLYFYSIDDLLHYNYNDNKLFLDKLYWFEKNIAELWKSARNNYDAVNLYTFSDHGMLPVQNYIDFISIIERANLKLHKDSLIFYDSTMIRCWFGNNKDRKIIKEILAETNLGYWIEQEEKTLLGLNFPDNRFFDELFLLNPFIMAMPSYMGNVKLSGMHGYHPNVSLSDAVLLSSKKLDSTIEHIKDISKLWDND